MCPLEIVRWHVSHCVRSRVSRHRGEVFAQVCAIVSMVCLKCCADHATFHVKTQASASFRAKGHRLCRFPRRLSVFSHEKPKRNSSEEAASDTFPTSRWKWKSRDRQSHTACFLLLLFFLPHQYNTLPALHHTLATPQQGKGEKKQRRALRDLGVRFFGFLGPGLKCLKCVKCFKWDLERLEEIAHDGVLGLTVAAEEAHCHGVGLNRLW